MTTPLFVLLFAIYPILFIAASNPGQVAVGPVVIALAVAAAGSTLLLAILSLVLNRPRAGLTAVVFIVVFYAYGPIHSVLEAVVLDSIDQTTGVAEHLRWAVPHLAAIAGTSCILLGIGALVALSRLTEQGIDYASRACNTAAIVIVSLALASLALAELGRHQFVRQGTLVVPEEQVSGDLTSILGYNPDIYVIILDGYARGDVLERYYGFDNSEFLSGLRSRGFQVTAATTSNYNWTFLSLASSLNMDYLPSLLGDRVAPTATDQGPVYDAIRNNAVSRFLKQRAYRYIHFQTTWGATLRNPYADEQVRCHAGLFTNEFYRVLAEASWLKALQSKLSADLAECYASNLDSLARMGSRAGPKFVLAHFLPPHHPYLFDREGRVLRNAQLSNQFEFQKWLWEEKPMYIDQLLYMNRRIAGAVDQILLASPRPPIVIIMSDHGPGFTRGLTKEEEVRVRLSSFGAFLLPGSPAPAIPDDASAVNYFRDVLNHYFKAGMPPLPDRHYFSPYERPYALEPVTVSLPRHLPN